MSTGDDLLIVLPCLNERTHLPDVLGALRADPATAAALFVIADGGSTDGTREWAIAEAQRDARVILLDNPARRQGAAVNLATCRFGAGRSYLLRIDVHAGYPEGFVGRVRQAMQVSGAGSVVISMRTVGRGCFQRAAAAAQNSRLGTGGAPHRLEGQSGWVDHGHHALFTLAEFMATGGYDESFVANEDAELDQRLTAAGRRIWLAADIRIDYFPRSQPAPLFMQYCRYGAGRAQTLRRHRARPKVRQVLPALIAPALLLLAVVPLTPLAAAPAALWAIACTGYGAVLAVKTRSLCVGLAGPAAMIMHLGWSLGFWASVARKGASPPSGPLAFNRG